MIKIGIVGGTGYAGVELSRWLARCTQARFFPDSDASAAKEPYTGDSLGQRQRAAAQAAQDTNLMFEQDETMGLCQLPLSP